MAIEFNSAANLGLNTTSGPNLNNLLDKIVAKEMDRLKPTQELKDVYTLRHDSWKQTRTLLGKVNLAADKLVDRVTWSSKKAISSDPEIVTATADSTAVPGVYPLIVDKVASYHQIGSQRFAKADAFIGNGIFSIGLLDEKPLNIKIGPGNNTLEGLANAMNDAKIDVSAKVVKLGNDDTPYQLILTSKESGAEGRIEITSNLQGGDAPDFSYRYTQPSPWLFAPRDLSNARADDKGGSTTTPIFSGNYTGKKDLYLTFSAVNTGRVGGDDQPIVEWKDNYGRSGQLKLGKFDYPPGSDLDVVDGVKVRFSEGDLKIDDSFTVHAKPTEDKYWWVPDDQRPSKIDKPTPWAKQITEGLPEITGNFQSDYDDVYHFNVRKGGVIGVTDKIYIDYTSDNGEKGTVDVGLDYKPGQQLSLGKGLFLTMQKGTLQTGFQSDVKVESPLSNDYWWLFDDGEDSKKTLVNKALSWQNSNEVNLDEKDLYDPNSKRSNAEKKVVGTYKLDEDKTYTVKVKGNGTVGIADALYLEWDDGKGKKGTFNVGRGYTPGTDLKMEGGLSLQMGKGYLFQDDYFTFDAFSPTIVPPQDSEIRLNPLDNKQGGVKYTSSTKQIKNAIEGVVLDLHKASDKIVTITIEEDKAKAKESIANFVKAYNDALVYMKETLKYDPETKIAGPLQAEYQLANIQDVLRTIIVDAIPGLPRDANTLPYAGITIKKDGTLEFDEAKLDERLAKSYDKVANLFRNVAVVSNPGIIFVSSTLDTKNSGEKGYDVAVNKAATQGTYESAVVDGPMNIQAGKNKIAIAIDGKTSQPLEFEPGDWTLRQIERKIAKTIRREKAFSNFDVETKVEGKKLKISSGSYGSASSVVLKPLEGADLPFLNGQSTVGKNVEGMINNHPGMGSGRILSGANDQPEKGLRFLVASKANEVGDGKTTGKAVYTIGKGGIVKKYLTEQLKEKTGTVDTGVNNVGDRIQNLEEKLVRGAERVERKKDRLGRQFANVEKKLAKLNSVKQDITSQFQNIGS